MSPHDLHAITEPLWYIGTGVWVLVLLVGLMLNRR